MQPQGESQGNIVVVDDMLSNLRNMTTILMQQGYHVLAAIDGESALNIIRTTLPDVILLDIMLPGMDGYEVCRRLKARRETCEIPIIFMSGLEEIGDKVTAFEVGGVDYVTKPFQIAEVLARVKTHLTLRKMQQRLEEQNAQLQEALANVKTLKGLLPICAGCKKIRDDQGYWNQLEAYIESHSDALFSHGLCPECLQKLYAEAQLSPSDSSQDRAD